MSVSPFDSVLYGRLLSDSEMAELFSDAAQLTAMVTFERALARVQGRLGIIPVPAAEVIDRKLLGYCPDPALLADDTDRSGVPVPGFVKHLRDVVGGEEARYIHWGATSQDVLDTAVMLQLSKALARLDQLLKQLCEDLIDLTARHRDTVISGRTRWQQAVPTSFGLKVAGWADPLISHSFRLTDHRSDLLVLSFAGAAGNLSALGQDGLAVAAGLSRELDLAPTTLPWHSRRGELALLCADITTMTTVLGKMALDIILMSQTEVGELREGGEGRGGSSTMPNKANPTRSEAILSLARFSAGLTSIMQGAVLHAHERDGAAWSVEWLTLGQAVTACSAALVQAIALIDELVVDQDRMRANIAASNGLMLAEAASFALSAHMPRPEAQALVKTACARVVAEDRHLFDMLEDLTDLPVDWTAIRAPENHMGEAPRMVDRFLAENGRDL